jgi:quercetin dioxygenase-like cupin family protein
MKIRISTLTLGGALAMVGLAALPVYAEQAGGSGSAARPPATAGQRTPQEPVATTEEFRARVIRQTDLPMVELVPGSNARLVAGQQSMISFLKMDKHSYFAPHRHPQEQIMIVLEGYCDEIIEGKRYRVQKGDVIVLPSNIEHGAYIYDEDVLVIDVFGEVRADYLVKMLQVMATLNSKKAQ